VFYSLCNMKLVMCVWGSSRYWLYH